METSSEAPRLTGYDPSTAMRWFLATLSFGAGAIHLAMVPQHAQESLTMGLAFAAAGWFQIAFGAAIWALSRTIGLPGWTGHTGTEPAGAIDIALIDRHQRPWE